MTLHVPKVAKQINPSEEDNQFFNFYVKAIYYHYLVSSKFEKLFQSLIQILLEYWDKHIL